MSIFTRCGKAFVFFAAFIISTAVNAATQTYNFSNVSLTPQYNATFTSATVDGYFDYDTDSRLTSNINLTLTIDGSTTTIEQPHLTGPNL